MASRERGQGAPTSPTPNLRSLRHARGSVGQEFATSPRHEQCSIQNTDQRMCFFLSTRARVPCRGGPQGRQAGARAGQGGPACMSTIDRSDRRSREGSGILAKVAHNGKWAAPFVSASINWGKNVSSRPAQRPDRSHRSCAKRVGRQGRQRRGAGGPRRTCPPPAPWCGGRWCCGARGRRPARQHGARRGCGARRRRASGEAAAAQTLKNVS